MTEELKVKARDIVVPGETLAEGMGFLPSKGTYRDDKVIRSSMLGIVSIEGKVIKLVPISGIYTPKIGDKVIGKVIDILMSGWRLDIQGPYSAVMGLKEATSEFIPRNSDLTQYHKLGDYLFCKVTNVTSQKLVDVTLRGPGLRKLRGGRIIKVSPNKVPRIIGKEGSMATMIKNATGCFVFVGQNGLIWIDGEPDKEVIAVDAIKKIEKEAHIAGLTDVIKKFLESKTGPIKERPAAPKPAIREERPRPRKR